jgi:hypothetical protein
MRQNSTQSTADVLQPSPAPSNTHH